MKDMQQKELIDNPIVSQLSIDYELAQVLDTSGTRCPIPLSI